MSQMLLEVVALLAAAVILVPLSQRLGLGSVLGYLIAGVLLGPHGLGWVADSHHLDEISELGVVFLLFLIGLELDPKRLWRLKLPIFGMGAAQLVLITGIVAAGGVAMGMAWESATVLGMALSMSSTAIATQILQERRLLAQPAGSSAFSVLLFQDLAVIPILALLPWLAGGESERQAPPAWQVLVVIVGVIVIGRFFLRHVFRLVAASQLREIFTALCLLIVVGLAALMQRMGLSMALGAFMGGVLLATSEYRHAIETDIEPFKGLLLGLFFMSVGKSVDMHTIVAQPGRLVLFLGLVLILKVLAQALLGAVFRLPRRERWLFGSVLSQGGEFAFVLFGAAGALGLLSDGDIATWSTVVALSMGTTPLLVSLHERWFGSRSQTALDTANEVVVNEEPEVIIAGFGRVGQIVARLLYANRVRATVLDHDPEQIEAVRRFGFKVYYGDARRVDLLAAAGARTAKIAVVAVDDVESSLQVVDRIQQNFPHLRLVVRARNVDHAYRLIDRGVELWERETFDSSVRLGTEVLRLLGLSPYQAVRAGMKFRRHNLRSLHVLHASRRDQKAMLSAAKQAREDLAKLFTIESENLRRADDGWDVHPEGR